MSLAPSKRPRSAEPAFDLDYSVHDFASEPYRDSQFLFQRLADVMVSEGTVRAGRTLDVACGTGNLGIAVHKAGGEAWGIDPSGEMLGISRWLFPADQVVLVRGIAEELPFARDTFDRVLCQGSLDHFVHPERFMREAARIVKPEGRVVIALANYDSLSCWLGKLRYWLACDLVGRPRPEHRAYWQPPPDHFHKGDLGFVRRLGGRSLGLERCYGVSLLWLLYDWKRLLERLPASPAFALLEVCDQIARRTPALADMIISVWRPVSS